MKKIIKYTLLALFIVSLSGCEEYLDVNQNPNDLTISTPELVFNGAAKQIGERQMIGSGFSVMGAWTGYFAHCGGWSGWQSVKSYVMTSSDYTGFWSPYTGDIKSLNYVESGALAQSNFGLVGASKILKAISFERIVDTYGDVPYFESGQGFSSGNTTPVYDDAQLIYEDLVVELDSAIIYLNRAITENFDMEGAKDPIMGGDREEWIRFANAAKLRILIKQSDIVGRDAYITANWTFDALGFPTEVTVNPGYLEANRYKMNPLYESYYKTYQGNWASANTQYGLNVFLKNLYDEVGDARMLMCWKPGATAGDYSHGIQFGMNDDPLDHWGTGDAIRIGQGIAGTDIGDIIVMSEPEILFLIAEATARGRVVPDFAGTAEDIWKDAIEASFYYYGERAEWDSGVIDDTLTTYMASIGGTADLGWDVTNPVRSIIYQKYIAGVGVYNYQAWTDFRRTGYPEPRDPSLADDSMVSYYPTLAKAQVPVRMLYVQDELDLNNTNVEAAIALTGVAYDSQFIMDARIFWDVN